MAGIVFNLLLIAYFKYANFFVDSANALAHVDWHLDEIVLPLAISFFTFQQIAYLVDVYKTQIYEKSLLDYALFVTFFPQLIAGPIVHHGEMLPQFKQGDAFSKDHVRTSQGLTVFLFGLFKKVVLADSIAIYASPVFSAAANGGELTFVEAWGGCLAYTFQLYFDFSGYSDMAIGIALLFGIRLPINFDSPYKAANVIDFWRRWHITLSRFLRDYLYIGLGGNRRGRVRRYLNLMLTMLLGGLWHGAGWTFVFWGALHGVYLAINHGWRSLRKDRVDEGVAPSRVYRGVSRTLTFLAVVVSWVFFRSESFAAAQSMLLAMTGAKGIMVDARLEAYFPWLAGFITFDGRHAGTFNLWGLPWIVALAAITQMLPNVQEIVGYVGPEGPRKESRVQAAGAKPHWFHWKPSLPWAILVVGMSCWTLACMSRVSEFLYFQF